MTKHRVAVISDIHANFQALSAVNKKLRVTGVDAVVVLGDLLTYGCDVNQTLDMLSDLSNKYQAQFLIGNHDEFYFTLQGDKEGFCHKISDYVEESVEYTLGCLDKKLSELFVWQKSCVIDDVYFSHANPYEYGNWSYLNTESELEEACIKIRDMGFKAGVFGHTHRAMIASFNFGSYETSIRGQFSERMTKKDGSASVIANPGSCGQPRGTPESFMIMTFSEKEVFFDSYFLEYDLSAHLGSIKKSGLSVATKNKLISFFGERQ